MTWKKNAAFPNALRTKCGGTDFDAPTLHALHDQPDGYIILTDGGAGKPAPSKIRRCFILIPETHLLFDPDKQDIVITMKNPPK